MTNHISEQATMCRKLAKLNVIILFVLVISLVNSSEAIVKQQQQQQQSSQQSQQQARNDDPSHQGAFNNHQQNANSNSNNQNGPVQFGSQSAGSSSSVSMSSGPQSSQPNLGPQSEFNMSPNGAQSMNNKQSYYDSMAVAANSPEQSYQAASNSVNMALANSGLYGSYNPSASSVTGSSSQGPSASQSSNSLNPLHYYYYPAKDSGSQQKAGSLEAAAAAAAIGNQFQSISNSYPDQLSSGSGSLGPDTAASNQDPSYVPQPNGMNDNSNNNNPSLYGNQQNQHQSINGNQNGHNNGHGSYQNQDLGVFSNNLNPSQVQQQQQQQQQHNQVSFQGPSNGARDFMGQASQQGNPQSSNGPSNSMFNQMSDLYTSNYGSPSVSAPIASYMPPNSQSQNSPQDPFASSSQHQVNSLFGSASSFLGQQQVGNGNNPANGNNLYQNQAYLNSLLPHHYNQYGGNQQPNLVDPQGMVSSASQPSGSIASAVSGKRFGISSIIMPVLALAGLSLLIPTMSNIGSAVGRKKRSIDDKASLMERQQQILYESMNGVSQLAKESSIGEYLDKIERYYAIYKNAAENDDCLNRLICEFGDAVKDITGKSAVIT